MTPPQPQDIGLTILSRKFVWRPADPSDCVVQVIDCNWFVKAEGDQPNSSPISTFMISSQVLVINCKITHRTTEGGNPLVQCLFARHEHLLLEIIRVGPGLLEAQVVTHAMPKTVAIRASIRAVKTVLLEKGVFVPYRKQVVLTKNGENDDLHSTHKNKGLRSSEPRNRRK